MTTSVVSVERITAYKEIASLLVRHQGLTAEQLMTSPTITTYPDAPLASVAQTMTERRIRQLPVVDADGVLAGIVSRQGSAAAPGHAPAGHRRRRGCDPQPP